MSFRVGPWNYALRISSEPIFIEGKEKLGRIDESTRTIELSPACEPTNRLSVLLHELAHGWCFAVGEPSDVETLCDFVGTICVSVLRDLAICGGVPAMERLGPGERLGREDTVALTRNRYCAKCESTVAGASVICVPVAGLPGIVELSLVCPHCNHVQHWREAATLAGVPSGAVVGEPRFSRGAAVATFVERYPQCGFT